MALYMYQFSYTPESWAAQLKKPENRIENVGRAFCEAAVALAVTAGGAIGSGKTTVLMSGSQGVEAL